jgi:hypothetical protein
MAANEPAIYNWDDDQRVARVEDLRPTEITPLAPVSRLAAVPGSARSLRELRAIACWTFLLTAGLAVWIGAIYGFLRLLSDTFS